MTQRLNEKYVRHLQQCEIGSEEFIEVMEAAWWALTHAMDAVGTHLDLTDEYLLALREKVHKYMNDEIKEVNA